MEANLTDHDEQSKEAQVSGRWIRDQLREVAGAGLADLESSKAATEPVAEIPSADSREVDDDSPSDLVGDLAASISNAVAAPIRDLERRRSAEHAALTAEVEEHGRMLETAAGDVQTLAQGLNDLRAEHEAGQSEHEAIASRLEKLESANVVDALADLASRLDALQQRMDEVAAEGRDRAERLEKLASRDSLRSESMRHVGELLERMREAVRMSERDTADGSQDASSEQRGEF